MIALARWIIIAIVVGVIVWVLWSMGILRLPQTPEQQVTQDQIECVAADILADRKGEPNLYIDEVSKRIGETVRRFSIKYKTDVCQVFEQGLIMIPPGYKRKGTYWGRLRWYVKGENTDAAWNSAVVLATQILKNPLPTEDCATTLLRAPRSWSESPEAIAGVKALPPAPVNPEHKYQAVFYCAQ